MLTHDQHKMIYETAQNLSPTLGAKTTIECTRLSCAKKTDIAHV